MITANLGQIQGLKKSTTAPTNTSMLWYDVNTDVLKYYDDGASSWLSVGSGSGVVVKGNITANTDFPEASLVQVGWIYKVLADVSDDYTGAPLRTNTGQEFTKGDLVFWDGVAWDWMQRALVEFVSPVNTTYNQDGNIRRRNVGSDTLITEVRVSGSWNEVERVTY